MTPGEIVLVPFPFAELTNIKVRPALVVCITSDRFRDLILCQISSVVPKAAGPFEIILQPDALNGLRAPSVIKVDRIVTLKRDDVIASLGNLSPQEWQQFKKLFHQLVA